MGDMSRCKHGGFIGYCEICNPYVVEESGPWAAGYSDGKVFVESEDFTHDVRLYVDGDFGSTDNRKKYAEEIARRLNDWQTHN